MRDFEDSVRQSSGGLFPLYLQAQVSQLLEDDAVCFGSSCVPSSTGPSHKLVATPAFSSDENLRGALEGGDTFQIRQLKIQSRNQLVAK